MKFRRNGNADLNSLICLVAERFYLNLSDLKEHTRDKETVLARQVAMYLCWCETDCTLGEIGKALDRSPATVSHGFQQICWQIGRDEKLKTTIGKIKTARRENTMLKQTFEKLQNLSNNWEEESKRIRGEDMPSKNIDTIAELVKASTLMDCTIALNSTLIDILKSEGITAL